MKFSMKFNTVYTKSYSSEICFITDTDDRISGILYLIRNFGCDFESTSPTTKPIVNHFHINIYYGIEMQYYYIEREERRYINISPIFLSMPETDEDQFDTITLANKDLTNMTAFLLILPYLKKNKYVKLRRLSDAEMLEYMMKYKRIGDYVYTDMFGKREVRNIFSGADYFTLYRNEESHLLSLDAPHRNVYHRYYLSNKHKKDHSYILKVLFDNIFPEENMKEDNDKFYMEIYRRFLTRVEEEY